MTYNLGQMEYIIRTVHLRNVSQKYCFIYADLGDSAIHLFPFGHLYKFTSVVICMQYCSCCTFFVRCLGWAKKRLLLTLIFYERKIFFYSLKVTLIISSERGCLEFRMSYLKHSSVTHSVITIKN